MAHAALLAAAVPQPRDPPVLQMDRGPLPPDLPASRIEWNGLHGSSPHAATASVALCLAGQLRTLSYSWMQAKWEANVLAPIRPATFMHVSAEFYTTHGRTSSDEMAGILRLFKPVSLKLQDDDEVIARPGGVPKPSDARLLRHSKDEAVSGCSTCEPLLLRWRGCYEDLLRFEEERDSRPFQWVIRSRPDLSFECSFPDASRWPQTSLERSILHLQRLKIDAPPTERQERRRQQQQQQQQQPSPPPLALLQEDYYIIVQRSLALATLVLPIEPEETANCTAVINGHDKCIDWVLKEQGAQWFEVQPALAFIQRFISCAKTPLPPEASPFLREAPDKANSSFRLTGGQWRDDNTLVNGRTHLCHLIADGGDENTTRAEDASEMWRSLVASKAGLEAEEKAVETKECPLPGGFLD